VGTACADHGGAVCDGAGSCIPTCGDGIVEVALGEQCDLGSANGTGGCSATCQLSAGSYLNETESNDTQASGNHLDGHLGAVGALTPAGDVDWYLVDVTVAGSSITAEIGDGLGGCPSGFDSRLSLFSSAGALLATNTTGGVSPCSKIAPQLVPAATNLPTGQYALKVERVSGQPQADYVLTVHVAPPGCGDGLIQTGEQCDPGPTPVAGCSATCQLTGDFIPEAEPNDTQALANPLGTHAGFIGSINPVGDQDFFSFAVPGPASSVTIQTSDGIGGCPVGFDSLLTLFDPGGVALVQDDNGGVAGCSQISPTPYPQAANLSAGTYRVRIQFTGNQGTQKQYVVTISIP
jgi:cysteine-rich repeat protein